MSNNATTFRPPNKTGDGSTKSRVGGIFILALLLELAAGTICFFAGFFVKPTRMLTWISGESGGDVVIWLFWIALLTGFGSALAGSAKWYKRILTGLGLAFVSFAMMMPVMINYDYFLEYRAFRGANNRIEAETFRFVDADHCGKGGYCGELTSDAYPRTRSISINYDAYNLLVLDKRKMPQDARQYWPSRTITDYCVRLSVEHRGPHARILIDGKLTTDDLFLCP